MIRRWFIILVVLALAAGTILSLPAFWARPVIGEKASQYARHWLDCVFTASSALTGTGLSPHDINDDFNPAGQALILACMQAGGLGVLIAGSIVGWRFRRRSGWGASDENASRAGLRRLIIFVCASTLLFEAAGAAAIHYSSPPPGHAPRALFIAVFHSVSAFCNTGLTLTRDSLVAQSAARGPYTILLPLMVLGSIGGPVLYELWRKSLRSSLRRSPLSRDSRITLLATAGLVLGGGAAIFFTESTPRWQLRNPREDTPGRLMVAGEPEGQPGEPIIFSADDSSAARSQRIRNMPLPHRAAAALFQSVAARTSGFRVARLDEDSISPADRATMMALMLVGGGLGGSAGGLRITVVALLLATLVPRRRREPSPPADNSETPDACSGRPPCRPFEQIDASRPPCPPSEKNPIDLPSGPPSEQTGFGQPSAQATATLETASLAAATTQPARAALLQGATAVAVALTLLIGFTALFLIYRESAAVDECAFEAICACTNTGLSSGAARLLSPEGQVTLILAMLLGRIIPLAMLANYLKPLHPIQSERSV